MTFSYELAPLMLTNDDLSLFSVAVKDPRTDDSELIANDRGVVSSRKIVLEGSAPSAVRAVNFGNRDWSLVYYAKPMQPDAPSRRPRSSEQSGLR